MKEIVLLRSCQLGILAGGILLICMGCGIGTQWLRPLIAILVIGAVTGLLYEQKANGNGDGPIALALPALGALSGVFVLVAQA